MWKMRKEKRHGIKKCTIKDVEGESGRRERIRNRRADMIKCYAHVQRCHNETHYSVEIIYTNKVIKV